MGMFDFLKKNKAAADLPEAPALLYSANFQRTDWTDTGNLTRSLRE